MIDCWYMNKVHLIFDERSEHYIKHDKKWVIKYPHSVCWNTNVVVTKKIADVTCKKCLEIINKK